MRRTFLRLNNVCQHASFGIWHQDALPSYHLTSELCQKNKACKCMLPSFNLWSRYTKYNCGHKCKCHLCVDELIFTVCRYVQASAVTISPLPQ